MRHRKKLNHLSRKHQHRKAMLANMANSLIMHKRIKTTLAKAKALRVYVEPLITRSKNDSTHSRRVVFSYLKNKDAVSELFRKVAKKVGDRPGGYTRILKLGNRLGDNAEMCYIELVDYNENMLAQKEEETTTKKRTRRGRRRKKKSSGDTQNQQQTQQSEQKSESQEQEPTEQEEKKPEEKQSTKKPEQAENDTPQEESKDSDNKEDTDK